MKNYKKGILVAMVLSAMSLMAAEDKTIKVTTFVDEDGENSSACSLREAIKTAKLDRSYGGCNVGRRLATEGSAPDVIQLEAGEYKLDRELVVESAVNIFGATIFSYTAKSPITNQYPNVEAIKTSISGQGKVRLFNTVASQAPLNIYQVSLKDGYSGGDGGAIYIAGSLGLYGSELIRNKADGDGAAIYSVAMDVQQSIVLQENHVQDNIAKGRGSVLAMDCIGNLGNTQTNVNIFNSSLVQNGSNNTQSILDFCGYATVGITNNTIAKNNTHSNGHVIRMVNETDRPLSSFSTLTMLSNTIVENTARSVLYYDNVGSKMLGYNVLAYNNGLSCEYALNNGVPAASELILLASVSNAIQKSGNGRCVLPDSTSTTAGVDNIDLSNISMSSVLSPYLAPTSTTRYLGLYYPRDNKTSNDLVNVGTKGCAEVDQRGILRNSSADLLLDPNQSNSCEIGSVEIRRLSAKDILDIKNESYDAMLKSFDSNIDQLKAFVANKNTPAEELPGYEAELKDYEELKKYTEQYQKYRAIYFNPFTVATPDESLNGNTIDLKILNSNNYDVSVNVIGTGVSNLNNGQINFDVVANSALKCEWKPDLKRIMMYRTDGQSTNPTDYEFCSYTLREKNSQNSSQGLLKARFENIAPITESDEYLIRPENNLVVRVNPLENDSDNGDGSLETVNNVRPSFYHNSEGLEIPIRIIRLPAGVTLKAQREGQCPGDYQRETCYGGELTFSVSNAFSQSDYAMEYMIFDAEEKESNTSILILKNTVRNTNTSSGGGSVGIWGFLGLLGLAMYRRFKD